jgi:Ca2+-binding RTX toxin-like protein
MRGIMRLLPAAALIAGLVSVPRAYAQPTTVRQPCTIFGTSGDDTINGTDDLINPDVICARAGDDVVNARDGDDEVSGGSGNDTIVAGDGSDVVLGADGNDVIRTDDGVGGNDAAIGGPGFDTCIIDLGDFTNGCEAIVVVP